MFEMQRLTPASQLVVQEFGDDGEFSQSVLDILYATEVRDIWID